MIFCFGPIYLIDLAKMNDIVLTDAFVNAASCFVCHYTGFKFKGANSSFKIVEQYKSSTIMNFNLRTVVVSERLRTRKPLGSSREGSNPADNVFL